MIRATKLGMRIAHEETTDWVSATSDTEDYPVPNWKQGISVVTSFDTHISKSVSGAESRKSLLWTPGRRIEFLTTGISRERSSQHIAFALNRADSRTLVPVWSDYTTVTAYAADVVDCDTTFRRIFKGQKFMIFTPGADGEIGSPSTSTFGVFSSGKVDGAGFFAALDGAGFPLVGAIIVPLTTMEITLIAPAKLHTATIMESMFKGREVIGSSQLPPTIYKGALPPFGTTFQGRFVFDLDEINWRSNPRVTTRRAGQSSATARGRIVYTRETRALFEFYLMFTGATREDVWRVLQVFESHRGRGATFWVNYPYTLFTGATSSGATTVAVVATATEKLLVQEYNDYVKFLAVKKDGILYIVEVDSVGGGFSVTGPGFDIEVLNLPTALQSGTFEYITSGHMVRFRNDSLTERWKTTDLAELTTAMVELEPAKELSKSIANLAIPRNEESDL